MIPQGANSPVNFQPYVIKALEDTVEVNGDLSNTIGNNYMFNNYAADIKIQSYEGF